MGRYLPFIFFLTACAAGAQVPVSKEPLHHNVFENTWVRVLDVRIPPGDTSLFHKHETPSVFMILASAKTGSETIIEPAKLNLSNGNIWYESFEDKPRIHRIWNSDTTEFHVMDVELLHKDSKTIDLPEENKSFKLLLDEKQVRAYRVTLDAQASIQLIKHKTPVVVVGLTDGAAHTSVNDKAFSKKGDFIVIDAGNDIHLVNKGTTNVSFAFFELK